MSPRLLRLAASCCLASLASTAGASPAGPAPVLPESLVWLAPPGNASLRAAWVLGTEGAPAPYLLRVRLAAGGLIPPHTHPDERHSTVLAGTIYVGFGEIFDASHVVAIPTGGVYVAPAGVPHFVWARDGDAEYQEAGIGPTATAMSKPRKSALDAAALKDFARRYTDAWCSQDPARVASFFAENGFLQINGGTPSVGREGITAAALGFMSAFPDMVVSMDDLVITDDAIVYRWTLTGTNTGPGGTGKFVTISGQESWKLSSDGRVAESQGRFDEAEYNRQLEEGFTPTSD